MLPTRIFFALCFYAAMAKAQPPALTLKQRADIHDSIRKNRWDNGGVLSHYSFRYMSELFPTAVIESPPVASPLRSGSDPGIARIPIPGDSSNLEGFLRKKHLAGLIVLHRGIIRFETYPGMWPEERHTLQSVTKVITTTLIAQLARERKLDLRHSVDTYLPELRGTAWAGISLDAVLRMRSGIEGSETQGRAFTDSAHPYYPFESALGVLPQKQNTPASVDAYIGTLRRKEEPGMKAEYHSVNTFLLGMIAERVTGKPYATLVSEKIWKPMGAEASAYVCLSQSGVPWMHGGISARLRDLARFGRLFTREDIRNRGGSLITGEALDAILAGGPHSYHWDFAQAGKGLLKTGFGNQGLYIQPEKDLVIAYFNYADLDWSMIDMLPVLRAIEQEVLLPNRKAAPAR